jgi:glyoxylase-like metal-dependent hydrolase (beta-lactamase superfamily II)
VTKVDILVDCEGSFATVHQAFPAIDDDEAWWLPVNCVLVRTGEVTVLVDTGAGPKPRAFFPDAESRLLDELGRLGVGPADVDIVVHTHLHIDHVGWDGAFPNARYVVHEEDWRFFMNESSLAERPHLREKVLPLENVQRVEGETEIAPGILVQPTPGHTPGHLSLRAGSLAVVGDLIAHELQAEDPELVFVNDVDPAQAALTRRRVLTELADEGAKVIAAHFRGIGRFERSGKGFRWAVE